MIGPEAIAGLDGTAYWLIGDATFDNGKTAWDAWARLTPKQIERLHREVNVEERRDITANDVAVEALA